MKPDLTKQTITLGDDNPSVSLMIGHVDAMTFIKAYHAEGWDNDLPYGDKELQEEAKNEESEIKHGYAKEFRYWYAPWRKGWQLNVEKWEKGAVPVTIRFW